MIEVSGYPVKEDFEETCARLFTQINTAIGELQYQVKRFADGETYMTIEEVAEYLRCDVESIPKMPRYRVGVTKSLYKRADVDAFMETKRIGM